MTRQGHDSSFPNQAYGWQIDDNSGWSLFDETGVKRLTCGPAGVITFPNLPSSNPHVVGQLYSNGGVLTLSAG
jgi:hypothetical protein